MHVLLRVTGPLSFLVFGCIPPRVWGNRRTQPGTAQGEVCVCARARAAEMRDVPPMIFLLIFLCGFAVPDGTTICQPVLGQASDCASATHLS